MRSTDTESVEVVTERLQALIPTLRFISKATATPSFSVGVLHEGNTIFTHFEGSKDVGDDQDVQVDGDTIYLLGSLTKAFVSAACGILVDNGILKWDKPLSSYVPFNQTKDPVISARANLLDALSHSTGFPQIDVSWYGAGGESIIAPEELLHIVNHIPVFPDFRGKFHYSNWMYALAGRIIEVHGGDDASKGWANFIRSRIFEPLSMKRSYSDRDDLPDANFAEPHTALDSGKPGRLPVPDFSDKTITGASAAIWSTVPDMLKWASAILGRLKTEVSGNDNIPAAEPNDNPLRQMSTILAHRFRVTEDTVNENSYGLGWARHVIPSQHLGWLSINGPQPKHILGKDSRPRLLFYHGGQITGYLNTVYLFPETTSAVIVLTNAQGAGDCSDWIAQAIIQELFDLQPRLDFHSIVEKTAKDHLAAYQKMRDEYHTHQEKDTVSPPHSQITGRYYNDDIRLTIDVFELNQELAMQFNERESQRHKLSHYHRDVFGFLPASREEQQLRCLVDYFSYEQFLVSFNRDDSGDAIVSLSWKMQSDFISMVFPRKQQE